MSAADETQSLPPPGPPFGPPKKADELGTLGKYRILWELGRGGQGGIYLGYDERLRRRTAVKVLLPEHAKDAAAKARFCREAAAVAQLRHDNIVVVYDFDEWEGMPYLAMEYLVGTSLADFLVGNPVAGVSQTLRVGREVCSALAAAHKMGVAHRDVKPSNIWLEAPLGKAKVLDFGLVKAINPIAEARLTVSGTVLGSPAYMSPEQARGGQIDHRTDVFSTGAVLYRMCTGRLPFQGDNLMDLLTALGTKEPTPVPELNPRVPADLANLIQQMLRKKPDDRPQRMEEVAARLQEIADRRQGTGVTQALPQAAMTRDTAAATSYTPAGDQMIAPIAVRPQDEHAFDRVDESGPKPALPPFTPAADATRGNVSRTIEDVPRATVVLPPRKAGPGRAFFYAALGMLLVMTAILGGILVRMLK